jgi:hypothetical protein
LYAVGERCGQIQRREVRASTGAAGTAHRVRDARTVPQSIEARPTHLPHDVDDEKSACRPRRDRLERYGGNPGLARRAGPSQPLSDEREERQGDADTDDGGRA